MRNRKKELTEFGKAVTIKLIENNLTQQDVIDKIKETNPNRYIDSSLMSKVLNGQSVSQPLCDKISEAIQFLIAEKHA